MTIDISTLSASTENNFDVPVVFDADGGAVAGFKVVGKNSAEYRKARRAQEVIAIKRAGVRGGKQPDAKTDSGAAYFLDNAESSSIAMATACVVGWYGFSKDGVPLVLSGDTLGEIFDMRPTWREKVSAAIEEDANFIKG